MMGRLGGRILIVDDDPDLCWALGWLVVSRGLDSRVVHRGEDAIAAILSEAFDLVFLDAKLPDLDGLDVVKRLRSGGYYYPPVVMVTGYHYCDDPVIREALMTGMIRGFVAKPFDHDDILGMIERFCGC